MRNTLPGTTFPLPEAIPEEPFSLLHPIFAVSGGGLLLSQITELAGLGATTVQNWVKRGWVSNPVNKKYSEIQVARILLINQLRPAMQLEKINTLLAYINGSVDDRSDDIIPDDRLYSLLCRAILEMERSRTLDADTLSAQTERLLEGYVEPVPGAKIRLQRAVTLMLLNIAAAELMQTANTIYDQITA